MVSQTLSEAKMVVLANISNSTNSTASCPAIDTVSFTDYAAFVAIPILLLLSFLERRGARKRPCRRFPLVDVNLLDTGPTRWTYAVTLGASFPLCLLLFIHSFGRHFDKWFRLPDDGSKPWLQKLIALASALQVGLVYFPFLACLKTRYKMVGLPLGLCYSITWFVVCVLQHMGCLNSPSFDSDVLEVSMPSAIFHLILVVQFARLSVRCYWSWIKGGRGLVDEDDFGKVAQDHDFRYVRRLLGKKTPATDPAMPWYQRYYRKYTRADDGVRFSAQMTITMVVSFLCLFSLAVLFIRQSVVFHQHLLRQQHAPTYFNIDTYANLVYALEVCWIVSGLAALLVHVFYIFSIMVNYRKHMRALYRGDRSWMPSSFRPSTATSILSATKYPGTQIAFILWGFFIQTLTFLFISFSLYLLFAYPQIMVALLQYAGPPIGVTLAALAVQVLLSAFVFSQPKIHPTDADRPLAIDNRKFYHVTSYFLFFYNVMMGLLTSLLRVLLEGSWEGARIDRTVIMSGWENWDLGYKSYLGMLRVEVSHKHPVLLVFCQRLLNAAKRNRQHLWAEVVTSRDDAQLRPVHIDMSECDDLVGKRAKRRWLVLYTVLRNPTVVGTRKHVSRMEDCDRVHKFLAKTTALAAMKTSDPRMNEELVVGFRGHGTRTKMATVNGSNASNVANATAESCVLVDTFAFSHFSAAVAAVILVFLSLFEKRTSRRCCSGERDCTRGRPGLLVPVNFLTTGRDRWSYAYALGASTNMCLLLFFNAFQDQASGFYTTDETTGESSAWVDQLIALACAVEVGLCFFPFLACLKTRYRLIGAPIGLGYSLVWLVVTVVDAVQCIGEASAWDAQSTLSTSAPYMGLLWSLPVMVCLFILGQFLLHIFIYSAWDDPSILSTSAPYMGLVWSLPVMVCLFILVVKFAVLMVRSLRAWCKDGCGSLVDKESERIAQDFDFLYVKTLLMKKEEEEKLPWYRRCCRRRPDDGFRFSARMTTTVVVSLLCLYEFSVAEIQAVSIGLEVLIRVYRNVSQNFLEINGQVVIGANTTSVDDVLFVAQVSWIVSGVTAFLIHIGYVFIIMGAYRRHIRLLYRGDRSWMPANYQPSTAVTITASMKYSGGQIAFILWGFIIQQMTFLLICAAVYICILFPDLLLRLLEYFGPMTVVSMTTLLLQRILATVVFSQSKINKKDKDRPLAIDNRRLYHITSYFLFFFNLMVGFFSSVWRLLLGGFMGAMLQARIDHSVLMRIIENWDTGFKSYLGMLRIEVAHTHPVLLVFIQHLVDSINAKSDANKADEVKLSVQSLESGKQDFKPRKSELSSARFKWLVLYTIFRNPAIINSRRKIIDLGESEKNAAYEFLVERILASKATTAPEDTTKSYIVDTKSTHTSRTSLGKSTHSLIKVD
ncbi:uncharacterized protein LOC144922227 [Branchiostoma floridae x Branchiostoma belcheri]